MVESQIATAALTWPTVICMVHVPVNTVLCAPYDWRHAFGLPESSSADWHVVNRLRAPVMGEAQGEESEEMPAAARTWQPLQFLEKRILREASQYVRHGQPSLMLEHVGAPYFVRGEQRRRSAGLDPQAAR
jgi:hypothetical protein